MSDDQVSANLQGMDDLDFTGWNGADWHGVFAAHHADDVLVDWKGQPVTHGIEEHIVAMKAYVDIFRWTALLAFFCAGAVWLFKKPAGHASPPPGAH